MTFDTQSLILNTNGISDFFLPQTQLFSKSALFIDVINNNR